MAFWRITAKVLIFALILSFYGVLLTHKIRLPASEDLGRHLKNGEMVMHGNFDVLRTNFYSYTEPAFATYNHHWLSGVIFYLVNLAAGIGGMIIFKIAVLLAAFSLVFFTALKKADFWLVALFSIPTILIIMERSELRPEIFSFLFIGIFLYLLADLNAHPRHARIFWLIPIQALWVNMHIFFSIGLMMVAGFLIAKAVEDRKNLRNSVVVKKSLLLFVALFAASCVNPIGYRAAIYDYQLHNLNNYPIKVSENKLLFDFLRESPPWADVSMTLFMPAVALLAASFALAIKQKPIFYFLAAAGSAAAGFYMTRGGVLFGLIFLPAVTANLNPAFIAARNRLSEKHPDLRTALGRFFIVVLAIALAYFMFLRPRGELLNHKDPGIGLTRFSTESADFFKQQGLRGPIFNDTDIGSFLIYYLFPQERVFSDNRFGDAYSKSFFNDLYLPALFDDGAWKNLLAKYDFNTIFFYQYDGGDSVRDFLWRRINDPAWAWVYADRYVVILVRNTSENKNVIERFHITRANVGEKLAYLLASSDPADQIAAADLFNLIPRSDLAMQTFKKVVAKWPEKSRVWRIMGEMTLSKNDFVDSIAATLFLEKAIQYGDVTAQTYSLLSLAYIRTNQFEKADAAAREALKINPDYQSAKDRLEEAKKYWIPSE